MSCTFADFFFVYHSILVQTSTSLYISLEWNCRHSKIESSLFLTSFLSFLQPSEVTHPPFHPSYTGPPLSLMSGAEQSRLVCRRSLFRDARPGAINTPRPPLSSFTLSEMPERQEPSCRQVTDCG